MPTYQNNITSATPANDPDFIRAISDAVIAEKGMHVADETNLDEKVGEALQSYTMIKPAQTEAGYRLDDDMLRFIMGYLTAEGLFDAGAEEAGEALLDELADIDIGVDYRDSAEPLEIDITIPNGDLDAAGPAYDPDVLGTDSPAGDYDLDELMERLDVCDVDELMEKLDIDDLSDLRDALDLYEDDDFSDDRFGFDSEAHDFDMDGFDDRFH